jgi:hypothetical protein
MTTTNEPRALSAALSGPAFATKAGGVAMHAANRHVERWAPEGDATRVRSMRSLGFVDRLVTPWLETAQRSAGLRMFTQYTSGTPERATSTPTSWLFPRPWYQDELDWLAAARQVQATAPQSAAPAMLTTRGTYVPRNESVTQPLPASVYEYIAPSLSVAQPAVAGGADAYSPLVPLAAASAAQLMSRALAPLSAPGQLSPGLRSVLSTMLARSTQETPATRLAGFAPEMVTPPAPREDAATERQTGESGAMQIAERYAQQRAQIAELERVTKVAAQRELAARVQAQQPTTTAAATATAASSASASIDRGAGDTERARIEERIRERLAERQSHAQRLHEQAREAAARDARASASAPAALVAASVPVEERRVPSEIAAAMSALPAELSGYIGRRPDRAVQAIAELGDALRTVELLARNAASGGTIESTRGPRLVMPAGLGGLVSMVDRAQPVAMLNAAMPQAAQANAQMTASTPAMRNAIAARVPMPTFLAAGRGSAPSALGSAQTQTPNAIHHVAWADRWLARFAGAKSDSLDVLSATSARPEARLSALAAAAPDGVFVAPSFFDSERAPDRAAAQRPDLRIARAEAVLRGLPVESARPEPVRAEERAAVRIDDSAETPDDVFAAISAAASRSRPRTAAAPAAPAISESAAPAQLAPGADRQTYADLVAHASPGAPGAGMSAQLASSPFAPALRHLLPLASAAPFDVRALFGGNLSATFLAGLLAPAMHELAIGSDAMPIGAMPLGVVGAPELVSDTTREIPGFEATYVSPAEEGASAEATPSQTLASEAAATHISTLRTALLSWSVESALAPTSVMPAALTGDAQVSPSARAILDSLALPFLAEPPAMSSSAWAAPGMTGERAQTFSVAQERSAADLSFDFVPPELVLAARVYGLGPAEAAQAMRLAIAGPGTLTTMAGSVDRAFVQALALEAERRDGGVRPVTAYPETATGYRLPATGGALPASAGAPGMPVVSPEARSPKPEAPAAPAAAAGSSTFGVERRAPRGSFLWPSAAVGALGIQAAAPDGEQSMSVAAIELLAARAVAELGTFAAAGSLDGVHLGGASAAPGASPATSGGEEREVLASATSLVPASRRTKFEALYLAVSQSPVGRDMSPAARAARALALAGRGDEAISARERAAIAWDVLPHVHVGGDEPLSTGAAAARETQAVETRQRGGASRTPGFELPVVENRPGLASLSGRAGEALGSYVTPSAAATASGSSSSRQSGSSDSAAMRAPTAAQELVRTGRPASRVGGGEVEIPTWFEAAARKMFEDRSSTSDGISLAELTLVNAAPSTAIAASTRGAPSAAPAAPAAGGGGKGNAQQIDIEQVANEVYRQILALMDAARARNGEPYL